MNKIASILLVLAVNFMNVRAESALTFFRHMAVEEGVSSNQVRSLLQDKKGFVWVGTDQGLDRYDGYSFRTYPLPNQWKGATIMALCEDKGYIWAGTDRGGVFLFDKKAESFAKTEIDAEVNAITKDKDGNLWISTYGQGVYRCDSSGEILKHFPFESIEGKISTVFVDRSNQVWVLTNWGTPILSRLNKSIDEFEEFPIYLNGQKISAGGLVLLEDSSQRFWLGSWDDGLYEINRLTGKVTRHLDASVCDIHHIHSMLEYQPGIMVIGSDNGLHVYDTEANKTWYCSEDDSESDGISSRFVYPLMKDREGSLWVGTFYGGLNYHSPFSGMFDRYAFDRHDPESVRGNIIGRFAEDSMHNIWVASDDGGLNRYDPRTGKFTNFRNTQGKNSASYDNVHALCMDGDDLWIGTYTGGVNVLDIKTGRFRSYMPDADDATSIDGTSSYAIHKDKENRIWIATMNGINLYNRERDNFIRMKEVSSQIIDIDHDSEGNLWFSTQGEGLMKYDSASGSWTGYRCSDQEGSIPGNYVNCGFLDGKGRLWFGTNSGLCYYESETDSFVAVDGFRGVLQNICGIVEDGNILWITTTNGLIRYEKNGGGMHVFSTSNGICSNQFIVNSIFKASDGRIYAGTAKGFNAFYPYQIKINKSVPEVVVLSCHIDNNPVPFYLQDRIEMSHKDNAITLDFSSLSYCVPYKNQYAYMLEGFEDDWNQVGNNNHATYTNLPAGKYVFLVKGTNNDAIWSESPAKVEIVVHPHPLLSTTCKILYVILSTLLLLFLIRMLLKFNDRKHEKAYGDLEKRTEKEIYEAKINFFTMIAHEIRTPVSLIIGPLEKVLRKSDKMTEAVREDLKIVERNSQRLLYLVSQLLDFRKVEQNSMVMRFTTQPVEPLIRSICERFEPTINHNGARLQVEYPSEPLEVSIDSEAFTKLVSNLLTNASKYTKDFVKVSCHLSASDRNSFVVSVYDNGCGISQAEQDKIFRPFYQTMENKPGTGIGLSLVKSIAELHGGSVSIRSEVGAFSEFVVTLPVSHEEHAESQRAEVNDVSRIQTIDDILNMEVIEELPGNKPVVLIVDDNEEIVHFLSDTLSDSYEVLSAYDGIQALSVVEDTPELSLIIADWMMPRLDGTGLCRKLRENLQTCHIPFILLTAKTDDASKVSGMDCGADIYIEKPFSLQYLEACIKNLITMRSLLRHRYASSPLTPLVSVASNSMDNRFLQKMTSLIEEHMSDSNLSVDFLTEQMGISRSSFYNKIKSLTDSTPNELIQLMRLKRAAQLLSEQKYRINEVCYMVGFNNPSYFSKCFAKQFGMKPGEFMNKSVE